MSTLKNTTDNVLKGVEKIKIGKNRSYQVEIPKGTRDYSPYIIALREKLFSAIRTAFKNHGAEELDTPVFELKETLKNKYGEDSKLIYDLVNQGGELLSLRYDLTVPLARYISINKIHKIKRYHIAKVYRRDNPAMTSGRYREFYQCDFDICGAHDPILPDVECCKVVCEILDKLDLGEYIFKVNHRKILDGYMSICGVPLNNIRAISSSLDKLDKIEWENVRKEMVDEKGLSPDVADKIKEFVSLKGGREVMDFLATKEQCLSSDVFKEGLKDMSVFFDYAKALNIESRMMFDLSLARGLDYYTGCIFEFIMTVKDENSELNVGSIAGGGRYDNLVGMFNKKETEIPAVGISVGVERLMTLLEEKMKTNNVKINSTNTCVLVSTFSDQYILNRLAVADILWKANIPTEISYKMKGKLLRDFQYCEEHNIPLCIIIGEEECKEGYVTLREMVSRKDAKVSLDNLVSEVRKYINEKKV